MRIARVKLTVMPNLKNPHGLESNFGSLVFASITLGAVSIISGFAGYPSGAGGRVSLVLVIVGFFLSLFAALNFKVLKTFELNNPSEVFSFSFYFLICFF